MEKAKIVKFAKSPSFEDFMDSVARYFVNTVGGTSDCNLSYMGTINGSSGSICANYRELRETIKKAKYLNESFTITDEIKHIGCKIASGNMFYFDAINSERLLDLIEDRNSTEKGLYLVDNLEGKI